MAIEMLSAPLTFHSRAILDILGMANLRLEALLMSILWVREVVL
jgi:hypothetical protein